MTKRKEKVNKWKKFWARNKKSEGYKVYDGSGKLIGWKELDTSTADPDDYKEIEGIDSAVADIDLGKLLTTGRGNADLFGFAHIILPGSRARIQAKRRIPCTPFRESAQ